MLVWGNGNAISGDPLDFFFSTLYFRICSKNKIKTDLILGSRQAG
jgi:hypothetical protein